jgi:hypothetical protein
LTDENVILTDDNHDGVYEAVCNNFTEQQVYLIMFYAKDSNNVISDGVDSYVRKTEPEADDYEPDDEFTKANPIILNSTTPQQHSFHKFGDTDWIKFYGISGYYYRIDVNNSDTSNAEISIFAADGITELKESLTSNDTTGKQMSLEWDCPANGVYYVRLRNFDPYFFGKALHYELKILQPCPCFSGSVSGRVTDKVSGKPLKDVIIKTNHGGSAITDADGNYKLISHWIGSNILVAELDGYERVESPITIFQDQEISLNISMSFAKGDVNGDGNTDLADVIAALRAASGNAQSVRTEADVNNDGRIGLEEAVYVLQKVARIRQ